VRRELPSGVRPILCSLRLGMQSMKYRLDLLWKIVCRRLGAGIQTSLRGAAGQLMQHLTRPASVSD